MKYLQTRNSERWLNAFRELTPCIVLRLQISIWRLVDPCTCHPTRWFLVQVNARGLFGDISVVINLLHYGDVTWALVRLRSLAIRLLVQQFVTLTSNKAPKLRINMISGPCVRGIHRYLVDSPHEEPVIWKTFTFQGISSLKCARV